MKNVIHSLKNSGYNLYLLSSNNTRNIEKFLKHNGLNGCFLNIYSAIGLTGKKRMLRKIIRTGKISPADSIYIANEPTDIVAAKTNNIKCIAAEWGYNNPELLKEKRPFAVVNKPENLISTIKEWEDETKR